VSRASLQATAFFGLNSRSYLDSSTCPASRRFSRDAFFRANSLPDVALLLDHRQAGETTISFAELRSLPNGRQVLLQISRRVNSETTMGICFVGQCFLSPDRRDSIAN